MAGCFLLLLLDQVSVTVELVGVDWNATEVIKSFRLRWSPKF